VTLSANGKTSTTCKILARKGNEKSWLIQDDGGTLYPDGSFRGFEGGGVFVKTEGVNPGTQAEIFYGLLKPSTLCENVYVDDTGEFDFYNFSRTSNGRAVVRRADFMHASQHIDVPRIDNFILITRGPLIPANSRLNCEQAAALMVQGQAMESSAATRHWPAPSAVSSSTIRSWPATAPSTPTVLPHSQGLRIPGSSCSTLVASASSRAMAATLTRR
jgi:phosphoenolpyruvate carboxykinase (ATP)